MLSDSDRPIIYVITEGNATSGNFSEMVGKITRQVDDAIKENVSMVQIREKRLEGRHLFELTLACAEITRDSPTKLLINDRADIAVAAGADGVHLTASSIPAGMVRGSFGTQLIIGFSAHTAEEVRNAGRSGADLVVYGPVFPTPGKGPAKGIEELRRVVSAVAPFPVVALGGIEPANCREVLRAGAAGIAGIRSFSDRTSIRSLRDTLEQDHGRTE